jgi:flagellar biosynthetic protein FlhB
MGVADYAFQVHRRKKRLMMTRYEVERETKETEGDPQHKARRQEIHQEIANSAMLEAVEDADFVVCNPTRLAVAMRYCKAKHDAPVVVAKGQHLLAQKIKQRARRAGVPVLRDVSLARALWELQVDQEIPPALYEAVAAVLRVVAETEKEP